MGQGEKFTQVMEEETTLMPSKVIKKDSSSGDLGKKRMDPGLCLVYLVLQILIDCWEI